MTTTATMEEALPEQDAPALPVAEEGPRFPLTVPLFLAAGWGALIASSAMFFLDEGKVETVKASTARAAVVEPATLEPGNDPLQSGAATQAVLRWDEEEPTLPKKDPPKAQPAPRPVAVVTPVAAQAPRSETPSIQRADHIGTWGPTSAACGARSRRRGYIPAVITEDGAQAGRTHCRFRNGRRDGVAWTATAECSDRGRHWTSQVRLIVDGDRLTWTSAKGPAFYVRCGRRDD